MPIIKPQGLLQGERLARCSDQAKLYWPFIYAASNGFGRFELDYQQVVEKAFPYFTEKPDEQLVAKLLEEYADKDLLFIYEYEGHIWGAWDSISGQQWFNAADHASPAPPEPEFTEWKRSYRDRKNGNSKGPVSKFGAAFKKRVRGSGTVQQKPSANQQGINNEPIKTQDGTNIDSKGIDNESSFDPHNTQTPKHLNTNSSPEGGSAEGGEPDPPADGPIGTPIRDPVGNVISISLSPFDQRLVLWDELCEAATAAGMAFDPDIGSWFCQKRWRYTDLDTKSLMIQGILDRIKSGEYDQNRPEFTHSLDNFAEKRIYKQPPRQRRGKCVESTGHVPRSIDIEEIA